MKLSTLNGKKLLSLTLSTMLLMGSMTNAAFADAKYKLKVAYENNPGEPFDLAIHEWAKKFNEKTNGEGELIPYPSSQLGSKKDVIEQMKLGSPLITLADGAFFSDYVPDYGIMFGPYLGLSYKDIFKLNASPWYGSLEQQLDKKGLHVVSKDWLYGSRHILANKMIQTPDDLKGLKIRVPNNKIQIKGLEAMGATPTPLPLAEVYTALNLKIIDGAENPIPVLYGQKHHEAAKFLILTGHVENVTNLVMGSKTYAKLPENIQQALVESGNEAGQFLTDLVLQQEKEIIEKMKNEGVTVVEVDRALFKEESKPFYNEFPEWSANLYQQTQDIINK
ncbi:C4-dicarboxylate TRAP transporter substrate-binding protein [Providencia sp. PROV116]|uniref:C4-dicarboxylate TRAP transporter substrate-binding protein n=1 Tax=Providencia sp. PROV116 TaxID=2949827 RepID=UPI00234ACDB4|nr:C4-dicarboxylate TRAP transporter substrate-binding protein [Providencia sp. PROV116]